MSQKNTNTQKASMINKRFTLTVYDTENSNGQIYRDIEIDVDSDIISATPILYAKCVKHTPEEKDLQPFYVTNIYEILKINSNLKIELQ